jgi:hypothetical protein
VQGGALYNVRPVTVLLPEDVPVEQGAAQAPERL